MWRYASRSAVGAVALGFAAFAAANASGAPRSTHAQLAGGSAPVTFEDSTGEDPAEADITSVVVSNDDAGLITLQVTLSNRPELTSDMHVAVFVDTNKNATDGAGPDAEGTELEIDLAQNDVALGRWNGSAFDFSAASPSSLIYSYANGATFKIKAADLGSTDFNFWVATRSGADPDFHYDYAPDAGHGTWNYQVKTAAPSSQLKLTTKYFTLYPKRPKAPGQLNASFNVLRLDTGAQVRSGVVTCRATIAGKPVRLLDAAFFKGTVNCNWQLSKRARGKTLSGTITVAYSGARVTRSFTVKIS